MMTAMAMARAPNDRPRRRLTSRETSSLCVFTEVIQNMLIAEAEGRDGTVHECVDILRDMYLRVLMELPPTG